MGISKAFFLGQLAAFFERLPSTHPAAQGRFARKPD
jgi:hypothetical protein